MAGVLAKNARVGGAAAANKVVGAVLGRLSRGHLQPRSFICTNAWKAAKDMSAEHEPKAKRHVRLGISPTQFPYAAESSDPDPTGDMPCILSLKNYGYRDSCLCDIGPR